MVSTTKTGIDFKGGQIGIEFLADGKTRVRMLEEGSTKEDKKQLAIFHKMGLPGGKGQVGEQYFNTNIVLINYSLIALLLQDLLREVFQGDIEKLQKIFAPDVIRPGIKKNKKDGKDYIQLEGPIGTALLNLHNYVATSDDPKVKEILERHNVEKMLRIINVDTQNRTRFFTPIKFATDHWLQAYSDYYSLDTNTWMLNDTATGVTPPIFELQDPYYNDVTNVYEAFGKASVSGDDGSLTSLTIVGKPIVPSDFSGLPVNADALFKDLLVRKFIDENGEIQEAFTSLRIPSKMELSPVFLAARDEIFAIVQKSLGRVFLANAVLRGAIRINNRSGDFIDLNAVYRGNERIVVSVEKGEFTRLDDGRLYLNGAHLTIQTVSSKEQSLISPIVHATKTDNKVAGLGGRLPKYALGVLPQGVPATFIISTAASPASSALMTQRGFSRSASPAPVARKVSQISKGIPSQLSSFAGQLQLAPEILATHLLSSLIPFQLVVDIAEAGGRVTADVVSELKQYPMLDHITVDIKANKPVQASVVATPEELARMIVSLALQQKVSEERMLSIFTASLSPAEFIEGIAKIATRTPEEITAALAKYPALRLAATTYRIEHLDKETTGKTITLKAEDVISPEALTYSLFPHGNVSQAGTSAHGVSSMKDAAHIEITFPKEGLTVDQGQWQAVKEHFEAVAEDAANKEHNHRGNVLEYFNNVFMPQEAAAYQALIKKEFIDKEKIAAGKKRLDDKLTDVPPFSGITPAYPNLPEENSGPALRVKNANAFFRLKYIISSGIGANEMFSHLLAGLHQAFGTSEVKWIVLDAPADLRTLPSDATDDNTLVIEFSRSGTTEETIKIAELTRNRFTKRIVYANKGPLKELGLQLQKEGKPVLVRDLESRIGGRLMRRLTPMTYGPMYLAGMDTKTYAADTAHYDSLLDFKHKEKSLAVALARFFFVWVVLGKRSNLSAMYNQRQLLKHSVTELRQFIMEGANKKTQYPLIANISEFPRDPHVAMEGVFGQAPTQIAFA
ncbi:MAG: hypothetical protein KKF80_03230, partial [Candidatus Omnitrophica bacterium]|nr:hypothetical protein [Candidatus Omnitrophota bacterium]